VRRRARAKNGQGRQPDGCEAGGTTRSMFEPGWSEIHFEALWLPQAGHGPAQASGLIKLRGPSASRRGASPHPEPPRRPTSA